MGNVNCVARGGKTAEAGEPAAPHKRKNLKHWVTKKVLRRRQKKGAAAPSPLPTEEGRSGLANDELLEIDEEDTRELQSYARQAELAARQDTPIQSPVTTPRLTVCRPDPQDIARSEPQPLTVACRGPRDVVAWTGPVDVVASVRTTVHTIVTSTLIMTTAIVTAILKTPILTMARSTQMTLVTAPNTESRLSHTRGNYSRYGSGASTQATPTSALTTEGLQSGHVVSTTVGSAITDSTTTALSGYMLPPDLMTSRFQVQTASGPGVSTQQSPKRREPSLSNLPALPVSAMPTLTWEPSDLRSISCLPKIPSCLLLETDHIATSPAAKASSNETKICTSLAVSSTSTETPVCARLQGSSTSTETPVCTRLAGSITSTETPVCKRLAGSITSTETPACTRLAEPSTSTEPPVCTRLAGSSTPTETQVCARLLGASTSTETPVCTRLAGTSTSTETPVCTRLAGSSSPTETQVCARLEGPSTSTETPVCTMLAGTSTSTETSVCARQPGLSSSTETPVCTMLAGASTSTETPVCARQPGSFSSTETPACRMLAGSSTSTDTPVCTMLAGLSTSTETPVCARLAGPSTSTEMQACSRLAGVSNSNEMSVCNRLSSSLNSSETQACTSMSWSSSSTLSPTRRKSSSSSVVGQSQLGIEGPTSKLLGALGPGSSNQPPQDTHDICKSGVVPATSRTAAVPTRQFALKTSDSPVITSYCGIDKASMMTSSTQESPVCVPSVVAAASASVPVLSPLQHTPGSSEHPVLTTCGRVTGRPIFQATRQPPACASSTMAPPWQPVPGISGMPVITSCVTDKAVLHTTWQSPAYHTVTPDSGTAVSTISTGQFASSESPVITRPSSSAISSNKAQSTRQSPAITASVPGCTQTAATMKTATGATKIAVVKPALVPDILSLRPSVETRTAVAVSPGTTLPNQTPVKKETTFAMRQVKTAVPAANSSALSLATSLTSPGKQMSRPPCVSKESPTGPTRRKQVCGTNRLEDQFSSDSVSAKSLSGAKPSPSLSPEAPVDIPSQVHVKSTSREMFKSSASDLVPQLQATLSLTCGQNGVPTSLPFSERMYRLSQVGPSVPAQPTLDKIGHMQTPTTKFHPSRQTSGVPWSSTPASPSLPSPPAPAAATGSNKRSHRTIDPSEQSVEHIAKKIKTSQLINEDIQQPLVVSCTSTRSLTEAKQDVVDKLISIDGHVPAPPTTCKPVTPQARRQEAVDRDRRTRRNNHRSEKLSDDEEPDGSSAPTQSVSPHRGNQNRTSRASRKEETVSRTTNERERSPLRREMKQSMEIRSPSISAVETRESNFRRQATVPRATMSIDLNQLPNQQNASIKFAPLDQRRQSSSVKIEPTSQQNANISFDPVDRRKQSSSVTIAPTSQQNTGMSFDQLDRRRQSSAVTIAPTSQQNTSMSFDQLDRRRQSSAVKTEPTSQQNANTAFDPLDRRRQSSAVKNESTSQQNANTAFDPLDRRRQSPSVKIEPTSQQNANIAFDPLDRRRQSSSVKIEPTSQQNANIAFDPLDRRRQSSAVKNESTSQQNANTAFDPLDRRRQSSAVKIESTSQQNANTAFDQLDRRRTSSSVKIKPTSQQNTSISFDQLDRRRQSSSIMRLSQNDKGTDDLLDSDKTFDEPRGSSRIQQWVSAHPRDREEVSASRTSSLMPISQVQSIKDKRQSENTVDDSRKTWVMASPTSKACSDKQAEDVATIDPKPPDKPKEQDDESETEIRSYPRQTCVSSDTHVAKTDESRAKPTHGSGRPVGTHTENKTNESYAAVQGTNAFAVKKDSTIGIVVENQSNIAVRTKMVRYGEFQKPDKRPPPKKGKVSDFQAPRIMRRGLTGPLDPKLPAKHINKIPVVAQKDVKGQPYWMQKEARGPQAQMPWSTKTPAFACALSGLPKRLLQRTGSIEQIQKDWIVPQIKQIETIKLENGKFPGKRLPPGVREKYKFENPAAATSNASEDISEHAQAEKATTNADDDDGDTDEEIDGMEDLAKTD